MYEKLKRWLEDDAVFGILMVVLVGVGSFGLGRLSVPETTIPASTAPAAAFTALTPVAAPTATATSSGASSQPISTEVVVVASRSGTKYHLPDCPGAKQMKPENRIEFSTIAAAEAAGYTPAANCPGL